MKEKEIVSQLQPSPVSLFLFLAKFSVKLPPLHRSFR